MRPLLLPLLALALLACGGSAEPAAEADLTAGGERSNQNAPPPRPGLTAREQAERLIALVLEGQQNPGARDRLRAEIEALPLDDPDVIQGRSACLDAWRAEAEGDGVEMAVAACRAVVVVLAGRHELLESIPMGPAPAPAPSVAVPGGSGRAPTPIHPRPDGTVDHEVQGELADDDPRVTQDDSPYDEYAIVVAPGWTIDVDMRSDAFDTYLWLIGPDGTSLVQDDDGGEGTNSRFTFVARQPGPYTVRANAYDGSGRGPYRLHVRAHP